MPTNNKRFAARVDDIQPFRVVEVLTRAKELESLGRDIVHMEAGEPDFGTALPVIEAGIEALKNGATYYSDAKGLRELRESISLYYKSDYGVEISAERIMITPGASGALLLLAGLLVDRDDCVLMADPGYPCNRNFMRLVEGKGVLIPVTAANNFQLTAALVAEHWHKPDGVSSSAGGRTVAALVASPANPTGAVISKAELVSLFNAVEQQGGYLLVDEIYHGLDAKGKNGEKTAPSILEITDQAFVINSFSKYFGMTGWRLGWLVAPDWALPGLEKLAQNLFISMSTMAQHAALKCFTPQTRDILDQRRDEFKIRRDFLLPALRELGFIIPQEPAGGLYIYADISQLLGAFGGSFGDKFGRNSQEFCLIMLEQHGLAITPGADFGHHLSDRYVRFAFTTGMDRLALAVRRMKEIFR